MGFVNVVHLLASPFVGGPERQVLGLAAALPPAYRSAFLSFAEGGRARPLLEAARRLGCEAVELRHNTPHVGRAVREVAEQLRRLRADVLCTSGYKPDLVGWRAARRAGVPVVAIAHGWTAVTWKVRLYEALDRFILRFFDAVACVSAAQADKVRRAGVPAERAVVIHNGIDAGIFAKPDPACRERVRALFSPSFRPACVVGAAGRLSPEKGFDLFVEAAAQVARAHPDAGFLLCGDGPLRGALARRIGELGLTERFVLAGFRSDLHALLLGWDLAVLPSHTEGLPVAVLEALAAGVPVVATAVGGTPEVIEDGVCGFLVPPADPRALARRTAELLADDEARRRMGQSGRQRVRAKFSLEVQAEGYRRLFEWLVGGAAEPRPSGSGPDRSLTLAAP
jgi:glycosyltransferase involved in cell wall biosynthesis